MAAPERPAPFTVGRLQLRWKGDVVTGHLPTTHLRVERAIDWADLRPPDLRPGQILVVRRLRGLPPLANGGQEFVAWQAAAREELAELLRRAARPANGRLPADAASVLFADAAEMLLSLTRDVLDNHTAQRWYWRRLLPVGPEKGPGPTLAAAWSHYALALPAAMGLLAASEARRAVQRLSAVELRWVIRAVHEQFSLPRVALHVALLGKDHSPPEPTTNSVPGTAPLATVSAASQIPGTESQPEGPAVGDPTESPLAPWQEWLPGSSDSLTPQAEYLIGLCTALHAAPARARSQTFAQQAASWLQAAPTPRGLPAGSQPRRTRSGREGAPETKVRHLRRPQAPAGRPVAPVQTPTDAARQRPKPFASDGIHTALGGVLYLANLLRWLDLPHRWSDNRLHRIGGWGIIEVLARALLGDQHDAYANDPLWDLLAALDHRELGMPVGAGVPVLLTSFKLPPICLLRFGESDIAGYAVSDSERLTFLNAAGYTIFDVPSCGQTADVLLNAELTPYQKAGIRLRWEWLKIAPAPRLSRGAATAIGSGCRRWFAHLSNFVREILERVLGPTLTPEAMLIQPAQITTSRTHIDLYMSLAQVRIEVRRMGLDLDPGWMPDLGHIVLFHYVDSLNIAM